MKVHCYLINLDRSTDRLADFDQQARAAGIQYTRIAAVDGTTIDSATRTRLFAKRSGHLPLGPREMGCFLSHRAAWQQVVDDTANWAFIAEDDIRFANAARFFTHTDWLPAQADMVKAETCRQKIRMSRKPAARPHGHALRRLLSYHGGTAGYFISKQGAEILLRETADKCDAADHILFNPQFGVTQHLQIWQLDPAICVQHRFFQGAEPPESTLDADRAESLREQKIMLPGKPGGLAKIWREISRPFIRAGAALTTDTTKVPYAGDP
ncbi:MAG: glycosyltransferase family 25 protein [Rhodobacteraceae bacterium]|nr:glycosyltransferase family 25 protein [Paracoccaceae bacterium]